MIKDLKQNYAHFLYNREVVFAIKYQVRVRIFNEDLFQLMKVVTSKWTIKFLFLA